jgi:HlyD family secretion protein
MKRSTWLYGAGGLLAAAGLLAWAFAPRPIEVEVATTSQGAFQTTIDEDAKTRLRDRYVVSAPLAGQLMRTSLREGDPVTVDAVVAVLTPVLSPMLDERSMREQRQQLEIAEAQVQRAKARTEVARVGLMRARNEVARTEKLAADGFVSPTRLETDALAAQAAQKELDAAVQERYVADHAVEQARAALMAVQRSASPGGRAFSVRSPVAGRVLRIAQPSEATVALGAPLLELGDTDKLEIVAELLTTDALKVPASAAVLIERWGGPGALSGRVRLVEPSAFTKVSALGVEEQRVKVLIDITSPRDQWAALGDGYRVGVRIVTLEKSAVLRVPVSAIFPLPAASPEAKPSYAVFRLEEGRARMTPIEIGARNGHEAWVQGGLAAGDTVIVYPPAAVKDGVRVSARKP